MRKEIEQITRQARMKGFDWYIHQSNKEIKRRAKKGLTTVLLEPPYYLRKSVHEYYESLGFKVTSTFYYRIEVEWSV